MGKSEAELEALAEACFRFSPQIAVRAREAIFIEIRKSGSLFSETALNARLKSLAQRMGFSQTRITLADDAASALAEARFQTRSFPLEAMHDYLSPFQKDLDGEKRVSVLIEKLRLLGILSLHEFSQVPSEILASRLGREAIHLHERIRGLSPVAWSGFNPLPMISEKTSLEDLETQNGSEGLEILTFTLKGLMDRAFARLRGRGERASVVQVTLELEQWSTIQIHKRVWQIDLPIPQGSVHGMIPIIKDRLDFDLQREPLGSPAISIQFEILESTPGKAAQTDLFNKREEDAEAWNALVARLCVKLGVEHVFVALPIERYLPEKAYAKVLDSKKISSNVMPLIPPRPARVLKKPEPVRLTGDLLVHFQSGRKWKTIRWEGPERLAGEWWKRGFHRDYFRIFTESGEQLWIFSEPAKIPLQVGNHALASEPELYLHGYFD
jgi:protein ImuB